ncbi:MAG: cadherin-like domain-containing protein, partial [Chitinophagales bacterium]|nr:cadherin-like domain-containing protein [Chitinophagales bacterium]
VATDDATVVITVVRDQNGPKNDPPVAGDDFSYTTVNTPVDGNFVNNDSDLNDDPIYMTKEDGTKVIIDPSITEGNKQPVRTDSTEKGGTITYYDNGTYTYNPPKDYIGPDRSVYGICDSTVIQPKPLCAEATVHMLVGGNNSTNAVNDENSTWINTPVDGNVMTNDFDKEGDVQEFESFINQNGSGTPISGSGQGTLVNGVDANGNTVTGAGYLQFDNNGNYTFTPINDFVGTVSVPYTIKDKDNPVGVARDTAVLEITVSPNPADANSVIANNDEYHTKGSTVESNIFVNDADPQGDGFEVTELKQNGVDIPINTPTIVKGIDENGNVVNNAGTLTVDKDGNLTFVPNGDFQGKVTFDYEITDDYTAQPANDKAQVVITVERPKVNERGPENNPPHAGDDFSYTTVNTPVNGNFVNNDNDPDNDPIYITKEDGTKVIIDPSITEGNKQPVRTDPTEKGGTITYYDNGTYTYNPPTDYVGPDRSVYGICDSTVIQPKPLCADATVHMLIGEGFKIEGNVFHDGNGMTDDYVNGNGTNVTDEVYAILTDKNGNVIQSVLVNPDGTYEFNNLTFGKDYLVVLDTVNRTTNEVVSTSSLPSGWVSTGEIIGAINVVQGEDGSIDGISSELAKPRTHVVDINFAIQQLPTADAKYYNLPTSAFSLIPAVGYPDISVVDTNWYSIPTNSPNLDGGYATKGLLTGKDPEDCPQNNACNTGATFVIDSIYPTTRLFYNFGGEQGVVEVLPGVKIPNYDPARLMVYGKEGTGMLDNPIGFTYALEDEAGFASTPKDYVIATDAALPVELLYFDASSQGCSIILNWATASELNNDYFEVQRSQDAINWETIARVIGHGTTNDRNDYSQVDASSLSGTVYYRLRQVDYDGTSELHKVVAVQAPSCGSRKVIVYPNPTHHVLNVRIDYVNYNDLDIKIYDSKGGLVKQLTSVVSDNKIDVQSLPDGTYLLQLTSPTEQIGVYPFIISK